MMVLNGDNLWVMMCIIGVRSDITKELVKWNAPKVITFGKMKEVQKNRNRLVTLKIH